MTARHVSRDKMKWVEMDVLNLDFQDESFDLVIDKGRPRLEGQTSIRPADEQEPWSRLID